MAAALEETAVDQAGIAGRTRRVKAGRTRRTSQISKGAPNRAQTAPAGISTPPETRISAWSVTARSAAPSRERR